MINNNRSVENAWSMLQYMYDELKSRKFKSIDITGIQDLDNLYALIISRWCASLAKEGLYKEYVAQEPEEMTSPMGQINVSETIARKSQLRGALVCDYDELSGDIPINHILKGTMQYILDTGGIEQSIKNEVKKAMQAFNGIGYVDINSVHWNDVKFNNSNMRYKNLITVCRTLVFEHKLKNNLEINDDKRLFLLFKRQLLKWCEQTYGEEDKVSVYEKPFTLPNESPLERNINKVQRLITISTDKETLMLCVRLQDEQLLDDPSLSAKHKQELVEYMRDYAAETKSKVYGCLIYVNVDKRKINIDPIQVNVFKEYMVGETTVDIHDQWRFVENKIKDAYKYFIERNKNKVKTYKGNKK